MALAKINPKFETVPIGIARFIGPIVEELSDLVRYFARDKKLEFSLLI